MKTVATVLGLFALVEIVGAEWQPLFNDRDLTGWTNVNCAPGTWSVRDGIIVSTGIPTGVLRTLREYENFVLELEWQHLKPGGNAGLFVHSGALPVRGQPFTKAIEIQIIDRDHPEGIATAHGDVFAIQGATFFPDRPHPRGWMRCLPSERRARPVGEWNHYRVECRDGRVTLAVNGKEVSGGSKCNPSKGFICLESEGSECHFRNIRIQELTPSREPAPDTPDLHFTSLYSGVDLKGWAAAPSADAWRSRDWILECTVSDAALRSLRPFRDFVLILDWRPKNSGPLKLALDGSSPITLDLPSATGWNRARVTVEGDHLSVLHNDKPFVRTNIGAMLPTNTTVLKSGPAEFANFYVRDLSATPLPAVLIAGGGQTSDNCPATQARLQSPFGVDFDNRGNMYIIEMTGHRLSKVDSNGTFTVIAGTGEKGFAGDGQPASSASFNGPHNIAVAPSSDIYIADTWNNRIRKIDARTGIVSTIAGTGNKGFSGDGGPAMEAAFGGVYCVSLDPKGQNLYVADLDNRRIRVVNLKNGSVQTVAGNGQKGVPQDGAVAINAPLVDPRAVIANDSEIYILERSGHALRVVKDGVIRTVAGTGIKGNSGDGGEGRAATLNGPKHLCFDLDGCVLIADTENHVIRRYNPRTKQIDRIAGTGKAGGTGIGGGALSLELNQPHGVYVNAMGMLYISDSTNHRVVRVQL